MKTNKQISISKINLSIKLNSKINQIFQITPYNQNNKIEVNNYNNQNFMIIFYLHIKIIVNYKINLNFKIIIKINHNFMTISCKTNQNYMIMSRNKINLQCKIRITTIIQIIHSKNFKIQQNKIFKQIITKKKQFMKIVMKNI